MIEEVAFAAAGEGDAPDILTLAWLCEKWGIRDILGEPAYGEIREITAALNTYNAVTRLFSLKGRQIHNLTSGERAVIAYLRREGVL